MIGIRSTLVRFIGRHRRSWVVTRLHGVAVLVENAYANVGSSLVENGELELVRRLAPGHIECVIDVGANVGDWSLLALREWPSSILHAFEVAPNTFASLSENVGQSGLVGRARLNQCGLGSAAGEQEMFYFPDHPELTCDRPRHDAYASTPFAATIQTGDDYMARHAIERVDLLKIDVEGAEHLVLDGFARTLAAERIEAIQFEYGAFSIQTRVLLADHYARLSSRFWIGKIFPAHVEFREYDWTMEDFRFANFFCVSKRRPDLRALAQG